jgi:hypothetical protein
VAGGERSTDLRQAAILDGPPVEADAGGAGREGLGQPWARARSTGSTCAPPAPSASNTATMPQMAVSIRRVCARSAPISALTAS